MAQLPLIQAIPRFKSNEERVDKFTNGTALESWLTSGGVLLPSLAKFLADKNTEINDGANSILAQSQAAATASAASAVEANEYADAAGVSATAASGFADDAENSATLAQLTLDQMVNPKIMGAIGNGVTSDQVIIETAVQNALLSGKDIYWTYGRYLSTATIPNFHDVKHYGPGIIVREGLGEDHVENGNFESDSGWTATGGGLTISGGTANAVGVAAFSGRWRNLPAPLVVGKTYEFTFKVTAFTSGVAQVRLSVGATHHVIGQQRTAIGTYTERFTANEPVDRVWVLAHGTSSTWSVDDVSVREVRNDEWKITPKGDERNIIYVGGTNLTANDGLTMNQPTNISTAVARMRGIGGKSLDGRWRIQLFGSITSNGVQLPNMPPFRNRLEIWGEAVALTSVPTTVWDGSSASAAYALRVDWSYNSAVIFMHFRNIKFTNWNSSGNAGGIVAWGSGDVLSENIHADTVAIGAWYRQCKAKHIYGNMTNCQTYGVGVHYSASGNVGDLNGGGVTFLNCSGTGVSVGRASTCYIQGSSFTGMGVCIDVTRNSRIRTQGNNFVSWTNSVVYAQAVGVWTPDNGQGFPDTYVMTPTEDAPVFRCESGSIHQHIQRYNSQLNSFNEGGSIVTIVGASGVQTLISTASGAAPGDFVPARVPGWWGYSKSASINLEMFISLNANAGGTLALHGAGSSGSVMLAQLVIPTSASARSGIIRMKFVKRPGVSAGRYMCEFSSGANSLFNTGASSSLNNAAIRTPSEDILSYRLYWTPADANQSQFADMRSYIEA